MSIFVYSLSSLSSFTSRDNIMMLWGLQTPRITVLRTQSVTLGCLNFIRQQRKMHWTDFLLHALALKHRLTDSSAVGGMSPFIFPTARWYQITALIMWCAKQKCESREQVQNLLTSEMWRSGAIKHQRHMPVCMCLWTFVCGCVRSHTINRRVKSSCQ